MPIILERTSKRLIKNCVISMLKHKYIISYICIYIHIYIYILKYNIYNKYQKFETKNKINIV